MGGRGGLFSYFFFVCQKYAPYEHNETVIIATFILLDRQNYDWYQHRLIEVSGLITNMIYTKNI